MEGGDMMTGRLLSVTLLLGFSAFLCVPGAEALDYPTREIELIAGYAPGSNTDNFARLAAKFGERHVGKPIVVVNKPPAARGFAALAGAKPDGYTIGIISNSTIGQQYLLKGVTFHYRKSYRVICQIDYSAEGLYVRKGGPFDIPLKELIRRAKEKPETLKAGIGGAWTAQDFTRAIFEEEAGVKFIRIIYPGAAEAIPNLLGGHVDLEFGPASEWASLYKAGKVNVLGVSTERRDPRFPDIPTFKEQGVETVMSAFHWIAAPAGTQDGIIQYLSEAFKKAFSEQGFRDAADSLGATGAWESPEESLRGMDRLDELTQRVVKKYDLKPQ
jgi:tripartite-type tricarboxylate transporter receptor subunit TctC